MSGKNLARLLVIAIALAAALGVLTGTIPFVLAIGLVLVSNAGAVTWLKWHEEQQPADRR